MQPVVDSIHELFVAVEALGSQSGLHLGEEIVNATTGLQSLGLRKVEK